MRAVMAGTKPVRRQLVDASRAWENVSLQTMCWYAQSYCGALRLSSPLLMNAIHLEDTSARKCTQWRPRASALTASNASHMSTVDTTPAYRAATLSKKSLHASGKETTQRYLRCTANSVHPTHFAA